MDGLAAASVEMLAVAACIAAEEVAAGVAAGVVAHLAAVGGEEPGGDVAAVLSASVAVGVGQLASYLGGP